MKPHTQQLLGAKWNGRTSLNRIINFSKSHTTALGHGVVAHGQCPSSSYWVFKTKQLLHILNIVIQMLTLPVILLHVRMRKAIDSIWGKVWKTGGKGKKLNSWLKVCTSTELPRMSTLVLYPGAAQSHALLGLYHLTLSLEVTLGRSEASSLIQCHRKGSSLNDQDAHDGRGRVSDQRRHRKP